MSVDHRIGPPPLSPKEAALRYLFSTSRPAPGAIGMLTVEDFDRAIMAAYVAGREEVAGELAPHVPEPAEDEEMVAVHLRVPRSVKGRWVRISRAVDLTLSSWIVRRVER